MADVLQDLTSKQESLLGPIGDEYLKLLTHPKELTESAVNSWLDVLYGLYDLKRPSRVEIAASPEAALKLATELTGEQQLELDWCGVADAGWVSFYDYFERIGVLTAKENAEVRALRDFYACAWDTIALDECAIVVRRPVRISLDDEGNLHSSTGPCLEWADGQKDFAHHGTWIPERMVTGPRSYTMQEFREIRSTEERRALCEIGGWDWVLELLGATQTDSWEDPDTRLTYELFRCVGDDGLQVLRKRSPKLRNGEQPCYLEPVHEDLKTAKAARKWQATDLSPQECERDPELTYGVEA